MEKLKISFVDLIRIGRSNHSPTELHFLQIRHTYEWLSLLEVYTWLWRKNIFLGLSEKISKRSKYLEFHPCGSDLLIKENGACWFLLQDYVPDATESRASFEQPQSPDSSYNNMYSDPEDYKKEPPPMFPPQLEHTLLNAPAPHMEILPPLSKPQHGVLDHLYIQEDMSTPSVVALGSTSRFQAKYVTVVLYKSTKRRGWKCVS